MKIPTYLNEKSQVIILKQNEKINNSKYDFYDKKLSLFGNDSVYLYLEDYLENDLSITIQEDSDLQIYIILRSSVDNDYKLHFEVLNNAKTDVFLVLRNSNKIDLTLERIVNVSGNTSVNLRSAILDMGKSTINDLIYLNEENAQINIDVLNIGSYNDQTIVTQDVFHNAKHTSSKIENSLISNANAKLKYNVSGRIFKGNEYSKCSQTNKGIILAENGEIEVLPMLFIDEYNVEANHGAAIGQIDDEQLYYLLSRGLTEQQARSLIISGYTKPFIANIVDEDIQQLVERQIHKKINEVDVL